MTNQPAAERRLVAAILLLAALYLGIGAIARADAPDLPHAFWGTVQLAGENVPAGTVVTARIGTTQVTTTTTLLEGTSVYAIDVPGDDDGDGIVRFRVVTATATQTATWSSGATTYLDLTDTPYCTEFVSRENWLDESFTPAEEDVDDWATQDDNPRCVADVDGDGFGDVIGFGQTAVTVSLSSGADFETASAWRSSQFTPVQGWTTQNARPRHMADVDGDGKADLVGFGNSGVWVSLSSGSAFASHTNWGYSTQFTPLTGWTTQITRPRQVADVDGNGKADLVGFGTYAVCVGRSNGSSFEELESWLGTHFTTQRGWDSQDANPRFVADVNGDGKADLVGFGNWAVYVALSTGQRFAEPPQPWLGSQFTPNQDETDLWHSQNINPRCVADVNGDGKADLIGFADGDIYVSLSTGSSFESMVPWEDFHFTDDEGWHTQDSRPRFVADVSGDGRADLVGCGTSAVHVGLAD